MSRRARALAFLGTSLACAALAATLAGGYGDSVVGQLGELRPVLVATAELPARDPITPRVARRALEVRRVPARFVPPGALTLPAEAIGRAPAVPIPAGSYVTADRLRTPRRGGREAPELGAGLSPVEIQVTGAGALAAEVGGERGPHIVDVVVTTDFGPGGGGRTFVAAERVTLLSLVEAGGGAGADPALSAAGLPAYVATLALTRAHALRLIDAESSARQIRLIEH